MIADRVLGRIRREKKFFWSLLIRVGSAILLITSSIVLARTLGPESFGIYTFALAVASILQLPATAGATTLVLRETAAGLARNEYAVVKGLWRWSLGFVGKLSGFVLVSALAMLLLSGDALEEARAQALFVAAFTVPLAAVAGLLSARLRGLGKVIFSQIPDQLIKPAVLVALILGAMLLFDSLGSTTAILLYASALALGLMFLYVSFRRALPDALAEAIPDRSRLSRWRSSLLPLSLLSGLQIINSQVALVYLGLSGEAAAVAELKLALSLAVFGTFAAGVVTIVLGPDFAKANAERDCTQMQSIAMRSVGMSMATSIPLLLGLILFSGQILGLAYGEGYLGARIPLMVVAAAYILTVSMGACSMILTMIGKEKVAVVGHAVGMVFNLTILFSLVPQMGALGGALAVSGGMIVLQIILLVNVRKAARIDPTFISVGRHLASQLRRSHIS